MTEPTPADLSKADAKKLTQKIKTAVDDLWSLLVQAHEGRAWKALGHATWQAYVEAEFGMSKRRADQLLEKSEVIAAIEDATGKKGNAFPISKRDVDAVKTDLPAVAEEIKVKLEAGEEPKKAVADTIAAKRTEKEQAREARKAVQAIYDKQREEHAAGLSDAVKAQQAAKAEAIAAKKPKPPVSVEALTAEIEELKEANAALEKELAEVKADSAKWEAMRVQFELGGFEKIIADKDEEIRVLETRVYSESEDKASWARSAKYWQDEARKLGFSNDVVIDIETGEVVGG